MLIPAMLVSYTYVYEIDLFDTRDALFGAVHTLQEDGPPVSSPLFHSLSILANSSQSGSFNAQLLKAFFAEKNAYLISFVGYGNLQPELRLFM